MARKGKKEKVRYRRMKTDRRKIDRTAPHSILATLVGASAGVLPFIAPNGATGGTTVIGEIGPMMDAAAAGDYAQASDYLTLAGQDFVNGIFSNIIPLIAIGAVAGGIGWAGRKYAKSSTNVSRKWRVF